MIPGESTTACIALPLQGEGRPHAGFRTCRWLGRPAIPGEHPLDPRQPLLGGLGVLPELHAQRRALYEDRTWVNTNLETKTGGPLKCGETGWNWRNPHPELDSAGRLPFL